MSARAVTQRGEVRGSRGRPMLLALGLALVPMLYPLAYVAVRATHGLVHRLCVSGPFHQITPAGGVCNSEGGPVARVFGPLLRVELWVHDGLEPFRR